MAREFNITPDSFVQSMVASTNGYMYRGCIGRLKSYPIPELPMDGKAGGLFLDIGCGWGRWLVSSSQKGFIPISVDIRLESIQAALRVLKDCGVQAYNVVADLSDLPFTDELFDAAWSFSAIQHAHRAKAKSCINHIRRCLRPGGHCKLFQFQAACGTSSPSGVASARAQGGRIRQRTRYDLARGSLLLHRRVARPDERNLRQL